MLARAETQIQGQASQVSQAGHREAVGGAAAGTWLPTVPLKGPNDGEGSGDDTTQDTDAGTPHCTFLFAPISI